MQPFPPLRFFLYIDLYYIHLCDPLQMKTTFFFCIINFNEINTNKKHRFKSTADEYDRCAHPRGQHRHGDVYYTSITTKVPCPLSHSIHYPLWSQVPLICFQPLHIRLASFSSFLSMEHGLLCLALFAWHNASAGHPRFCNGSFLLLGNISLYRYITIHFFRFLSMDTRVVSIFGLL